MADKIYLIGSLRNSKIPELGKVLRDNGCDVFDDWYGAGHEADDKWREYEQIRGRPYSEALYGDAARQIFTFDKSHLDACSVGVLVLPAGKSGHLELGYLVGSNKRTYILFDGEPERWDVMYQFATGVAFSVEALLRKLKNDGDSIAKPGTITYAGRSTFTNVPIAARLAKS